MTHRFSALVTDDRVSAVLGYIKGNPRTSLRKRTLIIERSTAAELEIEIAFLGAALGSSAITSFKWVNISQEA